MQNGLKGLTVLGSTGSIGTQTLQVVDAHPEEFRVSILTAGHNIELFREQLKNTDPPLRSLRRRLMQ